MKSATLGKNISGAEVTNISKHGFWILLADQEIFVAFKAFPWFKGASVDRDHQHRMAATTSPLLACSRYRSCCCVHSIP